MIRIRLERHLAQTMAAPLERLADGRRHHAARPGPDADRWDLPADGRAALRRFGLPTGLRLHPAFGEDACWYALGSWDGPPPARAAQVGAERGEGRVFVAAGDDGGDPCAGAPVLLNSSVAALVETAWRVQAALGLLHELPAPHFAAPREELAAYDERLAGCVAIVLDGLRAVDPAAAAPGAPWCTYVSAYPA